MIRVSTIYVGICMVLIAASLGVVLFSLVGIGGFEATMVSLVALTFLVLYQAIALRMRERTDSSNHIVDLSRGTADLARQMAEISRRLAAAESKLAATGATTQDRAKTANDEINELADLVTRLTATVALHEDTLAAIIAIAEPESDQAAEFTDSAIAHDDDADVSMQINPVPDVLPASAVTLIAKPANVPDIQPDTQPVAIAPQTHLVEVVKNAIAAGRIDMHLQPMLTLPQRKVRFYEAMTRLRDNSGQLLAAAEYVDQAASAGLIAQIDHTMILRCMQVLHRLSTRNKELGIFCNIAAETLADRAAFAECIEFLDINRAMAGSFILEFRQSTLRSLGPVASEHLAALAQRGYRFSMDHVKDLKLEPRELADLGIRYIKVPADLLLNQRESSAGDIHPADLADLLGRFGIDLVAEKIESERAVVDLLDYDIRYGQGYLFAAPRPLRPENAVAEETSKAVAQVPQESHAPATIAATTFPKSEPRVTGNAALARRALSTT